MNMNVFMRFCEVALNLLQLLKREVSEHSWHLHKYSQVFLHYANRGAFELVHFSLCHWLQLLWMSVLALPFTLPVLITQSGMLWLASWCIAVRSQRSHHNDAKKVWYFISKKTARPSTFRFTQQLSWQPFSVSDSVGITSSCSIPIFLLSISLTSSHLPYLCFSVSISNSTVLEYSLELHKAVE